MDIQWLLVTEKVQNIFQGTGSRFIHLRVMALRTGNGGKLLILDIKKLRKESTGSGDLSGFKVAVTTLWAFPVAMLHVFIFALKLKFE
ncbi:hypothetical protein AAFH98_10985 [Fodinibius sp. Rm-B-1B1-1]